MTWVFRHDLTGPQGATGPTGFSGTSYGDVTLADTGRYYDRVRFTRGANPSTPSGGFASTPLFLSQVRAVSESHTAGRGVWLQARMGRYWLLNDFVTFTLAEGPWPT